MPEENMVFREKSELLSYEEMKRLISVFVDISVRKVRLTGGEPFVRNDIMDMCHFLARHEKISSFYLTSNAVKISPYLNELKRIGLSGLNISLDSVNADFFERTTRRNKLNTVLSAIEETLRLGIPLKLNCVVLPETSAKEICDYVQFFKDENIDIRFIEYMPFHGRTEPHQFKSAVEIQSILETEFGTLSPIISPDGSTSTMFSAPNMAVRVGTIAAYTRNFCGSCNRIRLTSIGELKTCLYAEPSLNLRDLLRNGAADQRIKEELTWQLTHRHKNGYNAERAAAETPFISMSEIGG